MAAPPARTEISDTFPNPSNAAARAGFGKLYDYVKGLLGATGDAKEAQEALGLVPVVSTNLTDSSSKLGTTAWIRAAMPNIASAAGFSFAPGAIKFPSWLGGVIIQWGALTTSNTGGAVTYPMAFPNSVPLVFLTPQTSFGIFATHLTSTKTQVYVSAWSGPTTQTAALVEWLSIGY